MNLIDSGGERVAGLLESCRRLHSILSVAGAQEVFGPNHLWQPRIIIKQHLSVHLLELFETSSQGPPNGSTQA